jgi:hypothetical protein
VNSGLDPRVQTVRDAVRAATGSSSPTLASTIHFLEQHGRELFQGTDDLVVYEIYRDTTTSGRVPTVGDIVIPGQMTLETCPETSGYGIHFRKIYTRDSPPIRRGETPAVEFARTTRALRLLPDDIGIRLKPLAYDTWIYRSRVVPGQTFAAVSPFSDLPYDDAIEQAIDESESAALAARITASVAIVRRMHGANVAHGDLHLDNLMWISDLREHQVQPIDLAAAVFREDVTDEEWAAAVHDDLSELMREAGLLQLCLGRKLEGVCFGEARALANGLFPGLIAGRFAGL